MTIDQILFAVFGVLLGIAGSRLLDYMRGKDTVLSLQRDNKKLEQENKHLRKKLAACLKSEQDRIAQKDYQKDHGRDDQQVQILRILGTQGSKSVKQIAEQVGISEELAITHLVDLCRDNCVRSPHYMPDSESWEYYPHHSVWHIRQAGRVYLAQNSLL